MPCTSCAFPRSHHMHHTLYTHLGRQSHIRTALQQLLHHIHVASLGRLVKRIPPILRGGAHIDTPAPEAALHAMPTSLHHTQQCWHPCTHCLLPCHALPMLTPYASPLVAPLHPPPGPSPSLALSDPTTCLHQSTPGSPPFSTLRCPCHPPGTTALLHFAPHTRPQPQPRQHYPSPLPCPSSARHPVPTMPYLSHAS